VIRRRAWPQALFLGVSLFAWWYVSRRGSPWADGKALMIVSPAVMLAAGLGAASLYRFRRPPVAAYSVAAVLAFGVLLSNALAYYEVSLAPRERLAELSEIGDRISGQGPTLYTEFEEFAKHFLRDAAPEGTSEGWQRRYALSLEKQVPRFGVASDIDQFTERYVTHYRTIVTRRGVAGSRPPSIYRHVARTRHYDVWQRATAPATLIAHLSVGDGRQPAARPRCRDVRRLASAARDAGGRLVYAERPGNLLYSLAGLPLPPEWFVDPTDTTAIRPIGVGRLEFPIRVPRGGRYELWLEGSFGRAVAVEVDGRRVGEIKDALNNRGVGEFVGAAELDRGSHRVRIFRGGRSLAPGDGGANRLIGPLALAQADPAELAVRTTDPDDWRTLCRRSVDWVEAVRSEGLDR
jgi:hypothetical protein